MGVLVEKATPFQQPSTDTVSRVTLRRARVTLRRVPALVPARVLNRTSLTATGDPTAPSRDNENNHAFARTHPPIVPRF